MKNLNALNSLVNSIKNVRNECLKYEFDDVVKYCIEKHNETFDILEEMCKFIEDNFEIFYNPNDVFKCRYFNEDNKGMTNPRNRIICSKEKAYRNTIINIWVDDRFSFVYNLTTNKCIYIHNLSGAQKVNIAHYGEDPIMVHEITSHKTTPSQHYGGWCFFDGSYCTTSDELEWKRWNDSDCLNCVITSYEKANKTKKYVDWDYENALDLMNQFTLALKEIAEDEEKHLIKINGLKDDVL